MLSQVVCPNPACRRRLRLPEQSRERSIRCPYCKHKLKVPDASPTITDPRATRQNAVRETKGPVPESRPGPGVPQTIGRFEVREKLGAGAFGVVYRAWDPQLQREVALKVPHPQLLDEPGVAERFLREGKAAAGLYHPHIVPVYDACSDGKSSYLAAAYIEGHTLADDLAGRMDFRRAAGVVRDLAEALAYAHSQGVVHRDVKPANVLVDGDGEVHLTDFGLAYRQEAVGRLTHDGAVLGTPAYMAPEQAEGRQTDVGPASDQYSLGVVLYELLTGDTPFGGTPQTVLFHLVHTEPAAPRTVNPSVPPDLETICLKAMARDRGRRYASCQELADDLRRWLDGEPIRARRLSPVERVVRWVRRRPKVATLVGVTIGCLLLASFLVAGNLGELRAAEQQTKLLLAEATKQAERARAEAEEASRQDEKAAEELALARQAERLAERSRAEAVEANKRLQTARAAIQQARQEASEQEKQKVRAAYPADLLAARLALEKKDYSRAGTLLSGYIPGPNEEDLRTPAWHALWDQFRGQEFLSLRHEQRVTSVAFSPDGKHIAAGCVDRVVWVWDARTGKSLRSLTGHTSEVNGVCFSPDARRLASAGADATIKVWDTVTGQEQRTLKGHTGAVASVSFSPDGNRLASASADRTVRVWDAQTGQETLTLKGHDLGVSSVCFTPDGKRIISASQDRTVRVWDAQTGKEKLTFHRHGDPVTSICVSPDGKRVASGSGNTKVGEIKLWDGVTGEEILTLGRERSFTREGHRGRVNTICFSPDGRQVVSGSSDRYVKVWDAVTGQELLSLYADEVGSVCFSPDGERFTSASGDGRVRVWNAVRAQFLTLRGHKESVTSVCFSPDGKRLASGSFDRTIKVWDGTTGQEQLSLKGHKGWVYSVCFSPDGKRLASGADGGELFKPGEIKVWDALTGQEIRTLQGHTRTVTTVCFSPDGKRIASGSVDDTVRVWDATTGQEQFTLKGHTAQILGVCFTLDGKRIASASVDATVKVWDATTGQEQLTLKGHTAQVFGVCFSPDGRWLASASWDETVKVWDAQTGQPIRTLIGHRDKVNGVCFSSDGKRLASGSSDQTVKVWDVVTGQEQLTHKEHSHNVNCVCFSPDGKRLASASGELFKPGEVKVWDLGSARQR